MEALKLQEQSKATKLVMDRGPISVSIFNGLCLTLPAWGTILKMFGVKQFTLTNCFCLPRTSLEFPLSDDRKFESDAYVDQDVFNEFATKYYHDYLSWMVKFNICKMPLDTPVLKHYLSSNNFDIQFSELSEIDKKFFSALNPFYVTSMKLKFSA